MIAADCGIPSFSAHSLFVLIASSRSSSSNFSRPSSCPFVFGLSIIPVRETPRSRSSSQFRFHSFVRYLKLVRVDWNVPRIVASLTFWRSDLAVSHLRITTSERLQNSLLLRMISEQGLVPKSSLGCLLSCSSVFILSTCFMAETPL